MIIKQGDCLDLMKEIPSGSVDFICADLPFAMTDCDWDVRIPFEPMWAEFKRVIKQNAAIALFANGKFLIELAASNLKMYRYKIVWLKNLATGFLNAKKMPLKAHEDILIFYQKLPTYNPQFTQGKPYKSIHRRNKKSPYREGIGGHCDAHDGRRYPLDTQKFWSSFAAGKIPLHSTQKPVDLLEWLIKTYTNEGETVLDCCMGSGSTGVACVNTGREFIGYELDERYFEIAAKRIAEAETTRLDLV